MGARWTERGREVLVVARDDLTSAIRSMLALAALALYVLLNLAIAVPWVTVSGMLKDRFADAGAPAVAAASKMAWFGLYQFLTGDDDAAKAMLDVPVQAVVTFWAAALFAPLVSVIVAYDAMAADIQTGRIRFLTVRSHRSSLLIGRWIARSTLMAVVVATSTVAAYALMVSAGSDGEALADGAWRHFVRYGLLAIATIPCWTAVSCLASTIASTSRSAMMLGIALLLSFTVAGTMDTMGPFSPGFYKGLLYSPTTWPAGVGAYLGFSAAFLAAANLRLRTRDI